MARPRIEIDWGNFDKLCAIQCTQEEIAQFFNCTVDTIQNACKREKGMGFSEYYEQKAGSGKISLRRRMFELAQTGNVTMLIWLSKQYLGFSDKAELSVEKIGDSSQNEKIDQLHEKFKTMLLDRPKDIECQVLPNGHIPSSQPSGPSSPPASPTASLKPKLPS